MTYIDIVYWKSVAPRERFDLLKLYCKWCNTAITKISSRLKNISYANNDPDQLPKYQLYLKQKELIVDCDKQLRHMLRELPICFLY